MGNVTIMKAKDAISARLAECYVTINGRRYNFMQMIDVEFTIDKTKGKVSRLGAVMAGHKSYGMEGTFSGTMHYNTTVMRQLMADFKNTGVDTYFEVQITNDDPASDLGDGLVHRKDVHPDTGRLA